MSAVAVSCGRAGASTGRRAPVTASTIDSRSASRTCRRDARRAKPSVGRRFRAGSASARRPAQHEARRRGPRASPRRSPRTRDTVDGPAALRSPSRSSRMNVRGAAPGAPTTTASPPMTSSPPMRCWTRVTASCRSSTRSRARTGAAACERCVGRPRPESCVGRPGAGDGRRDRRRRRRVGTARECRETDERACVSPSRRRCRAARRHRRAERRPTSRRCPVRSRRRYLASSTIGAANCAL